MAKSVTNPLDRSRPSARLQPQSMLETTPVLFRLPSIQVHPLPSVADMPVANLQQVQSEAIAAAKAESVAAPVSIVSQPTTEVEEKRSWWEHWSSGVVLIVLLVALYITSIVVLKSRSTKPSNTLAKEKTEFGELADISVPKISPNDPTTEMKPSPGLELSTNAAAAIALPSLPPVTSSPLVVDELANSLANSLELNPTGVALEGSTTATDSSNNPTLATAQLLEPQQMPQTLPLLNSATADASGSLSVQPVSTQHGQSPTLYDGANNGLGSNLTPNQMASPGSPSLGSPVPSPAGLESTFVGTLPTLPQNSAPAGSLPTNSLPAYSQGYSQNYAQPNGSGNSIPNSVAVVGQSNATTSTVSTQLPSNTGSALGGAMSGGAMSGGAIPRVTVTPDANGEVEAIIRAYLELKRAGQAAESVQQQSSSVPANRYPTPPR